MWAASLVQILRSLHATLVGQFWPSWLVLTAAAVSCPGGRASRNNAGGDVAQPAGAPLMPQRGATCRCQARPRSKRPGRRQPLARSQRRNSRSISSSRPTSGVNADPRNASKRLATASGRSTCHAGTGASMPFTSTPPSSRYSKRSPTSRRVPGAMTTAPGSARVWSRPARFGVSPTTDCSCAEPSFEFRQRRS